MCAELGICRSIVSGASLAKATPSNKGEEMIQRLEQGGLRKKSSPPNRRSLYIQVKLKKRAFD